MSSRSALLWHLAAKDWRPLKAWAFLCWMATAAAWLPAFRSSDAPPGPLWEALAVMATLLPALAVARVLHLDAVPGTTQLWKTRPIPPGSLLLSKLALVGVTVLLPCFVIEAVLLALTDVPLRWTDHALVWIGSAVVWGVLYAGAALPAALTRNMAGLAFLLAAGYVAFLVSRAYAWTLWPIDADWRGGGAGLEASRTLVSCLLATAAALAGAAALYRRRRVRLVGSLVLALAVPLLAVSRLWPVDVTGWAFELERWPAPPAAPAVREAMRREAWGGARVLVDDRVGVTSSEGPETAEPAEPALLSVGARVAGLPPSLAIVQLGYTTRAIVEGRGPMRFEKAMRPLHAVAGRLWGGMPSAEETVLGCPSGSEGRVQIAELEGASYEAWPSLRDVRGTLSFLVVRPFAVARSPARPGQQLALPRSQVTIASVSRPDGGHRLLLDERRVVAPVFETHWLAEPDVVLFDALERRCYRSHARSAGQWLRRHRYLRSRIELSGWFPTTLERLGAGDGSPWDPAAYEASLARSELVYLSAEPIGEIHVPFRIAELSGGR